MNRFSKAPVTAKWRALHPRFFDEQLGSAVGAIDYVGGSRN